MYAARCLKLLSLANSLFAVALLATCGGSSATPPVNAPGSPGLQALPGLSALPAAPRTADICGPGWTPIDPLDKSHKILTNGCTSTPAGELVISGAGSTGFSIFAIQGFDGDAFPTSLQVELSAPASGQYFAVFGDYIAGCWRPVGPFTDSAEIEIPLLNQYTAPTAYTSPAGVFWLALLVEDGSAITVAGISIGVDGGNQGPRVPTSFTAIGSATRVLLSWNHSLDYMQPDFAGYVLERAPLFSGSFVVLTPAPVRAAYFIDSDATAGESYRYRIAARDACANQSAWNEIQVTADPSGELPPVPVVALPDGPLYAPATVTFDLSDSFDPMGEALTGFEIFVSPAMPALSGPGPSFTTTLQPGCYLISFTANTATRTGSTSRMLKVYPRWRNSSVLVCEPDHAGYRRLIQLSGIKDPASGTVSLLGQDGTYPGFARWTVPDAGSNPTQLPCFETILEYNGEPLQVGETTLVPTSFGGYHQIALYGPGVVKWADIESRTGNSPIAMAASPAGQVWKIWSVHPGATTDLYISEFMPGGSGTTVVANIGMLRALNAVYNPAKSAIEIIYADAGMMHWLRWDPVADAVTASAVLSPVACIWADIEISPATGLPLAAYLDGPAHRYRTRQLDALDVWGPELTVDDSANNEIPGDLAFAPDGASAEIFFALDTGQARLYELAGAAWSVRNIVTYSADSGIGVALMPGDSGRQMLVADALADERCLLAQLNDDGTDTVLWEALGGQGQGLELSGAASTDGVHVGWRDFVTSVGRHFSSADGNIWVDQGSSVGPVAELELASTISGELYLSHHDGVNAQLMWWDGADWQPRVSVVGLAVHRPFFGYTLSQHINWFAYEHGTTTLHHYEGNEADGIADTPTVLTDVPVWDGLANLLGLSPFVMAQAGGATLENSPVGLFDVDAADYDALYDNMLSGVMNFFDADVASGRKMATISYYRGFADLPAQAFWLTYGPLIYPARYTVGLPDSPQLTDLPFDFDINSIDQRRTVSAAQAGGLCAVGLVASIDGQQRYMEWSNFGDWEELELPAIERMSAPELLIGMDGRWHLIYKDYGNDNMYCRSSQ